MPEHALPPKTERPVVLVGFQAQGNLGLGYLAAVLRASGREVLVLDIERPMADIVAAVRAADPLLVGFSLIFQFYIQRYAQLLDALRAAGVACHFTMGGHYPTLNPRHTLGNLPGLDSVVRFEGEITLRELVDALAAGRSWHDVPGLAFRRAEDIATSPPRPLVRDLDELPFPALDFQLETVLGHPMVPLVASRGCARTCSFCSIHTFYRSAQGKVVRTRRPAEVVREMGHLYKHRGARVFLFQDDDFPLFGRKWQAWAHAFVDELHRAGLPGRVIWKISCRADSVDEELFARMRDAGLYLVYMGIESGNEEGLATLGKGITVEQNLAAVALVKRLGLMCNYGFMLLDPFSTFASVRRNVAFLEQISGDGSAAAVFCKMLPYEGTPIRQALAESGRLKGDACTPDYDFLDPRLDAFYVAIARIVEVSGWMLGRHAMTTQLNWAWNELAVIRALVPEVSDFGIYPETLRQCTAAANAKLFEVIREAVRVFEAATDEPPSPPAFRRYCEQTMAQVIEARNGFVARQQDKLLQAIGRVAA